MPYLGFPQEADPETRIQVTVIYVLMEKTLEGKQVSETKEESKERRV